MGRWGFGGASAPPTPCHPTPHSLPSPFPDSQVPPHPNAMQKALHLFFAQAQCQCRTRVTRRHNRLVGSPVGPQSAFVCFGTQFPTRGTVPFYVPPDPHATQSFTRALLRKLNFCQCRTRVTGRHYRLAGSPFGPQVHDSNTSNPKRPHCRPDEFRGPLLRSKVLRAWLDCCHAVACMVLVWIL